MHSNHFIELAKARYSCRSYDARPVEEEKLELVLEAARVAPSAVNYQPWHIYVIRDKVGLERIHEAYHREWFRTAPCVLVVAGNHRTAWKRREDGKDHTDVDVAIATDHMTLQATELGLATCWICNFNVERTKAALDLPEYMEPVVILPLGYPLDQADPLRHGEKRRPLSELVTYDPHNQNSPRGH
jgi:nitroreductase